MKPLEIERPTEVAAFNRIATPKIKALLGRLTLPELIVTAKTVDGLTPIEIAEQSGLSRNRIGVIMEHIESKATAVFGRQAIKDREKQRQNRANGTDRVNPASELAFGQKPDIKWLFTGDGSLYAGEKIAPETFLVGGSTWKRRETPYTKQLAGSEPGRVNILREENGAVYPDTERQLIFPSMVNAIVPVEDDIIVCCKHDKQAFNRITPDLQIVHSADDFSGQGVYNVVYDSQNHELVAVTRSGHLVYVDPQKLTTKYSLAVSADGARLWSMAHLGKGLMVVGDYKGFLYVVDEKEVIHKFYLPEIAEDEVRSEMKQVDPSVFGLTVLPNQTIVAGLRWGHLTWIEGTTFEVIKTLEIPWEISYVSSIPATKNLLIGTRQGILLCLEDCGHIGVKLKVICEIPPVLQHDNSIWSISFTSQKNCLVCFADGQVLNLDVPF